MIDDIIKLLEDWERLPLAFVTMAGPWLTPLIPAYFVAVAIQNYLDAPLVVALITGIVLSYTIFSTVVLFLYFSFYSQRLNGLPIDRLGLTHPNSINSYIYLLRRGVFKIGKTIDLGQRLSALKSDYKQPFEVIKVWKVDDQNRAENAALNATKHLEFREGLRRELRQGNKKELIKLVDQALR